MRSNRQLDLNRKFVEDFIRSAHGRDNAVQYARHYVSEFTRLGNTHAAAVHRRLLREIESAR